MTATVNRDALSDYILEKLEEKFGNEFEYISDKVIDKITELALDRHELIDFQMQDEESGFNRDQALWAVEEYMLLSINYFTKFILQEGRS